MPELKLFNPETATDTQFKHRYDFLSQKWQEEMPEDPIATLEFSNKDAQGWKFFDSVDFEVWYLWQDNKIIAELFFRVDFEENNLHVFFMSIHVLQAQRRKGYTRQLLEKVIDFAERYKRSLLTSLTYSRIPAGQGFAEHLGATKGLELAMSQLILSEVDNKLLTLWLDNAKEKAYDFEIGFWGNRYPESEIQAIADLSNVMNTAPHDDLDVGDWKVNPDFLREDEGYWQSKSVERRVVYVRHKPSGNLAGFTTTYWDKENPENLIQGDTGVLPNYRGYSLGKWLKAAMIKNISKELPVVKRIRTSNANSNAPMLAINKQLGFKPYQSETIWQLDIKKLKDYLQKDK